MEVTRLVVVLQILWSTWSKAEHRYSENDFDPAAWSSQYASSLYRPRSIQESIYFDQSTATMTFGSKPKNISEQMLELVGDGSRNEPTESSINEKEIVSTLLRYGQHHKYVLKTVLRGLKLLRDSSISDIQQCAREALFKVDEQPPSLSHQETQPTDFEQNEEKYIVKALVTEPNYMEFCVHKVAHVNMGKQVYDSIMAEMSSVIKDRQMKQLLASPDIVSSTVTIEELQQPTTSTPTGATEQVEASTISPTILSSRDEVEESSIANTESPFVEIEPSRVIFDPLEVTESREDINTALNKEVLTTGFSHQMTEPYRPYTSTIPAKVHSKIPLIYRIGTVYAAPGFNRIPHPYISIFTVGEIDPDVMTGKVISLHHPELHRTHKANEIQTTATEKLPFNSVVDIPHDQESSLQVSDRSPQVDTFRTVKKMLSDDEFKWSGPFAMERHHVKRSPTTLSFDVGNLEDQVEPRKVTAEDNPSTESSRAPKEYPLPLMISEAVPVISVPGEIPDLAKDINVIKEFAEPASTVEPPIVLKVQRVPTHVDTSEFWNTRKDEDVQESPSVYPPQGSEETDIQTYPDGNTTESTVMRESNIFKEEAVTKSVDEHSQDAIVTESFLETTTFTQGIEVSAAEVLSGKEAADLSGESISNESVSSSQEEEEKKEANVDSTQKASSENVDVTTTWDHGISHTTEESKEVVTQTVTETSVASEDTTVTESAADATDESLIFNRGETAAESAEGNYNVTTTDESGVYTSDEPNEVPTQTTTEVETSTYSRDPISTETTILNHGASDVTAKSIEYDSTVTSSEGSKTSEGATWYPNLDFVLEEFASSHAAKDDIPDEYMDYSISFLGELAKSITELRARSTMLKSERAVGSQKKNGTRDLSPRTKQDEDDSVDGNKDHQPTSMDTRHLRDDKERNMEALLASFQEEAKQKEPSALQQSFALPRSRRQAKHRELPSAVVKLLKDKGYDPDALNNNSRGSSAGGNQIPTAPQKVSKSRTQKILSSLSDRRRKGLDEDAVNETDADVDGNASILELININRVSHILEDKTQKKA